MDEKRSPKVVAVGSNDHWPYFRWSNQIAIGFSGAEVPLHRVNSVEDVMARTGLTSDHWNDDAGFLTRFVTEIAPGDIVVAKSGNDSIDGVGIVRSEYRYETEGFAGSTTNQHKRVVEWFLDFHELLGNSYDVSSVWSSDGNPFIPSTDVKKKDFDALQTAIMNLTNEVPEIEEQWNHLLDTATDSAEPRLFINQANRYKGNLDDFVLSSLSETNRDDIRNKISDLELEHDDSHVIREVLIDLLEIDSVTLWGALGKYESAYQDLRPGDWVLHLERSSEQMALQRADITFSNLSRDDRKELSKVIFGEDLNRGPFPCIWFSTTETLLAEGRDQYEEVLDISNAAFDYSTTGFRSVDSEVVNQNGGIEEIIRALTDSAPPRPEQMTHRVSVATDHPERARQALAHLTAGKNVLFYGPPGSGKTRLATQLLEEFTAGGLVETAHAEWTQYEVVGGPSLDADGNFRLKWGKIPRAAKECAESLEDDETPTWLLIDELNRANLDAAFGDVFTQLDLDYRPENPLKIGDKDADITDSGDESTEIAGYKEQLVPQAFRLLATMNSSDQAQLFALGYAFRRRFAFIDVPSLFAENDEVYGESQDPLPDIPTPTLPSKVHNFCDELPSIIAEKFDTEIKLENDTPLCFPGLETNLETADDVSETLHRVRADSDATVIEVLLHLAVEANKIDSVDLGQGLVIDAAKYVAVNAAVFPSKADWRVVDEAISAYYLPQFDAAMPELRKEKVTGAGVMDSEETSSKTLREQLESYTETLSEYSLSKSAARLKQGQEDRSMI